MVNSDAFWCEFEKTGYTYFGLCKKVNNKEECIWVDTFLVRNDGYKYKYPNSSSSYCKPIPEGARVGLLYNKIEGTMEFF